jgi:tRNA A37 methylthiotransferase MiaB
MNRQYTIAEIQNVLAKWRQELNIALSIDIIVGFPSETAEQFEDTISIVKQIQPDIVNISKFGARPKTRAAEMKPLPTQVIKERSTTLSELCDEIAQNQNVNYVKTYATQRVLTISRGKKSGVIARTPHYKPVILKEECELGKFYNVQLISAAQNYLRGRIIDDPHQ